MKRALSLLLAGILSLSLLAGCSSAEQLSAKPISLTAQELSAHGPTTQNAYDALSAFGLELLQTTEQTGESGGRDAGPVPGDDGRRLSGGPQCRLSVSPI